MRRAKAAPIFSADELKLVERAIRTVWNYVAADVYQLDGRISNIGAIEVCLDAGRLGEAGFAGKKAKEEGLAAEKLVGAAIDARGYSPVLRALSRSVRLV